jgi:hypothetical protein
VSELHTLKNRSKVEIEEAPERNVHGFKGLCVPKTLSELMT